VLANINSLLCGLLNCVCAVLMSSTMCSLHAIATLLNLPEKQVVGYFVNTTQLLKPAIEAVMPTPVSLQPPELAQIVSNLLPRIKLELPQLDLSRQLGQIKLPDLTSLISSILQRPQGSAAHSFTSFTPLAQAIRQRLASTAEQQG